MKSNYFIIVNQHYKLFGKKKIQIRYQCIEAEEMEISIAHKKFRFIIHFKKIEDRNTITYLWKMTELLTGMRVNRFDCFSRQEAIETGIQRILDAGITKFIILIKGNKWINKSKLGGMYGTQKDGKKTIIKETA